MGGTRTAHLLLLLAVFAAQHSLCLVIKRCIFTVKDDIVDKEFNDSDEVCCKHGIHDKYHLGQRIECCGEGTYRPSVDICCGGKVYKGTINQSPVLEKRSKDENGGINSFTNVPNLMCCGNDTYSPLTEICCEGVVKRATGRVTSILWDFIFRNMMKFKRKNISSPSYINVAQFNICMYLGKTLE
ncbi:galaxin-like [Saccostrea cucullata]|uniref:galaxin-like n=1 Tax=Saccostrea cuccullata TaxID=36930 RepID=UPI002ED4EC26